MFTYEIPEVEEDGSFFSASEEEVTGVQHLLVEPECNKDLVDSILGFNVFNPQKCFNIKDFSCDVEYDPVKLDGDAPDSDLTQGDKSKLEFIDDLLQVADEGVLHATNNLPALCEDYFLANDGSPKGYSLEQLVPESQYLGLCRRDNVAISESSATSITVLESTYDQNSFLLDKMTIHELHEAFRNMFGRETLVKDKQWLKHRILFGLQNLVKSQKNPNLVDHDFTSDENDSKSIFSPSNDLSARMSSSFTGVLYNTTKLGDRNGKRERLVGCDSLKTLSSEVNKARLGLQDTEEKEGSFITKRRLRKPTQRYVDESLEQQSKQKNKKCGVSYKNSRDKFLHLSSHKQSCKKGNGATPLIGRQESFREAIQVPFGIPIQKGQSKKITSVPRRESEDFKDCRHSVSSENNDVEPFLGESQDEISEDDCISKIRKGKIQRKQQGFRETVSNENNDKEPFVGESQDEMSEDDCGTGIRKGGIQRKKHNYWTTSEMMNLIEGISRCGVGKWSEIKNLLFASASHRTSVDLKDKWRNLLRASCVHVHSTRKVKQGRKHAPSQSILRRVRQLAVLHPYPKEGKFEDSLTTPIAPHTPASTREKSIFFSTDVEGK